jgi:hypothetical protein
VQRQTPGNLREQAQVLAGRHPVLSLAGSPAECMVLCGKVGL